MLVTLLYYAVAETCINRRPCCLVCLRERMQYTRPFHTYPNLYTCPSLRRPLHPIKAKYHPIRMRTVSIVKSIRVG